MVSESLRETGVLVHMDEYRGRNRLRRSPSLAVYCLVSGVLGAAVATVASFTVSGAASFVVWAAVLVSVCVLAGLGYGSPLLRAMRGACHRPYSR